jgi:hypothetical protein
VPHAISGRHPPSKFGSQNQAANGTRPPLHSLSLSLCDDLSGVGVGARAATWGHIVTGRGTTEQVNN